MKGGRMPIGRRQRAQQDKRERIPAAARALRYARRRRGHHQQIADRAVVVIGTL